MNDGRDPRFGDDPDRTPDADLGSADPVDVAALRADDAFLDALAAGIPVYTRDQSEYELAELLSGWRFDALAEPAPALPTVDEVEAAIAAAERTSTTTTGWRTGTGAPGESTGAPLGQGAPVGQGTSVGPGTSVGRGRRAMRHLRVLSGAAAVVVVAAAGLIVVSENSQPGDPLWGVKSVVFAEKASETQAMVDVQSDLEQAEAAVASGDTLAAIEHIEAAEDKLGPVRDEETRRRMDEWITRLKTDTDEGSAAGGKAGQEADRGAAASDARRASQSESASSASSSESSSETSVPSSEPSESVPPSQSPAPEPQPSETVVTTSVPITTSMEILPEG